MRQMTETHFVSLPHRHKAMIGGVPWALYVDSDGQTNFTPVELVSEPVKRPCALCGESQARKKVWATHRNKVLCMNCGQHAYFDLQGRVVEKREG